MQITEERRGSAVVLRLEGEFGESEPEFEAVLRRAIEDDGADVIVDLTTAAAFRPVRILANAEKARRDLGGSRRFAVVAEGNSDARVLLLLSGFAKIAPIFDTVDDVLQSWETDGMPI